MPETVHVNEPSDVVPDPNNAEPGPIDNLQSLVTGSGLLQYLQALLPGRAAKNQGYSFNRVIKVLNAKGHLPADFGNISYGIMKSQQRSVLHNILSGLTPESHGTEIFDKLKDAIMNKTESSDAIKDSESEGGVVVNRWALMVEFYVHPSSREELTKYFTKLSAEERPAVLTEGISNHRRTIVAELMRICLEEVAPNVPNCFASKWPALSSVHPENGTFSSSDVFLQFLSEARSSWDVLKSNLSKSVLRASPA